MNVWYMYLVCSLLVVVDLGYRLMQRKEERLRLVRPEAGGYACYIPTWLFGLIAATGESLLQN